MPKRASKRKRRRVYEVYRKILKMPRLSDKEIEEMRKGLILLAQTICEHVWGKKFY